MVAHDNLSPEQFRNTREESGYVNDRRYHGVFIGHDGQEYYLQRGGGDSVRAFHPEAGFVGHLSWWKSPFSGKHEIHKTHVNEEYRRRGIASGMLDFARLYRPDIQHSPDIALSEDAKKWRDAER